MKRLLPLLGLLLATVAANAEDGIPDLFVKKQFDCSALAKTANYFISLGQERAIEELKELEGDRSAAIERGFHTNERIGWVCRILFQVGRDKPLRQPRFGGLSLPYLTMPLERWPHYPVVESEGVFFVLSEGYKLMGIAERASAYIDYCSSNGTFRATKVNIPTRAEAIAAFDALKATERWKVIKWKDERPGTKYTISEELVVRDVNAQATATPEKHAAQGGADQPATAREMKPESKEKAKPEAEGRPQ